MQAVDFLKGIGMRNLKLGDRLNECCVCLDEFTSAMPADNSATRCNSCSALAKQCKACDNQVCKYSSSCSTTFAAVSSWAISVVHYSFIAVLRDVCRMNNDQNLAKGGIKGG